MKKLINEAEAAAMRQDAASLRKAKSLLQTAVKIHPESCRLRILLGYVLLDLEDWPGARDAFLAATTAERERSAPYRGLGRAHRGLGRALQELGELSEAETAFRRSLAMAPKPYTWIFLGDCLRLQERYGEAKECFEQCLALDPDNEEAYFNIGFIAAQNHNWPEALRCYRRALEIDPEYAAAYGHLGRALVTSGGDVDEAERHVRRSLELNPEGALCYCYLGDILFTRGDVTGAEMAYREAVRLRPTDAPPRRWLAECLERQGQYAECESMLKEAIEMEPDDEENWLVYADFLHGQDRDEDREECLRAGAEANPTSRKIGDALRNGPGTRE